jgi:hypothetical protein
VKNFFAQDTCFVHVLNDIKDKDITSAVKDLPEIMYSQQECALALQSSLFKLFNQGFITASYEIEPKSNDTLFVRFKKGKKVHLIKLNTDNVDEIFLNAAGFKEKGLINTPYKHTEITTLMQSLLQFAENHGYPFAVTHLENIIWQDSSISAGLYFAKNRLIRFDTLEVRGNLKLGPNYLVQYTGIEPGGLYNQNLITELENALQEIPFASVIKQPRIEFSGDKAHVVVFMDKKESSRFDFLIGVIPNNEITGRLIVTGEGTLQLQNVLGAGELFDFYFSKLESTSKSLETGLTYPYLPGIPLGVDASFDLFLKDSTFLERTASFGIIYQFLGNNYLKAFSSFYNSTVLYFDTTLIVATQTLPPNLDVSTNSYGLAWYYEKLNYRFNPRSGYAFNVSVSAGTKKILENNAITSLTKPSYPEFDFATLYDSLSNKSLAVTYTYNLQYFLSLFRRSTILFQLEGGAQINERIFQNELFRIGGNSILRGFDEQSLLASEYHVFTTEFRYLLSRNSYAAFFLDGGYIIDKSITPVAHDFPLGGGVGVTFETKAGIFGLSYALGSRRENPINIKNTKIHFGYINYF